MAPKVTQELCQPDPLEDELLTPDQLAQVLRIDRRGVHRLAREGTGPPHIQVSQNVRRWPRSGVVAWMQANTRAEVTAP